MSITERILDALRFAYAQEGKEVKEYVESVPRLSASETDLPRQV